MKKLKKLPILKLACAVALAMLAQLAFGQDQAAEHEPIPPIQKKAAPTEQTEPIPEPKYFLPQIVGAQYTYIQT
jgi:hypothetical protein